MSSAERKLERLWRSLEAIDVELDVCAGTPEEICELDLKELTELVQLQDKMERLSKWLKYRLLEAAGDVDLASSRSYMIDSIEHPILVELRKRFLRFRNFAAKIRRTNIKSIEATQ